MKPLLSVSLSKGSITNQPKNDLYPLFPLDERETLLLRLELPLRFILLPLEREELLLCALLPEDLEPLLLIELLLLVVVRPFIEDPLLLRDELRCIVPLFFLLEVPFIERPLFAVPLLALLIERDPLDVLEPLRFIEVPLAPLFDLWIDVPRLVLDRPLLDLLSLCAFADLLFLTFS